MEIILICFEPICFWRFPYYIFVSGGNREDKERTRAHVFAVSENPERPEIPEKGREEPVMAGDGETLQGVWGELSRKVSGWVGRVFEGEDTPME